MPAAYEVFLKCQGRTSIARSRDISPHGIGLLSQGALPQGAAVDLSIVPPEGMLNVEFQGRIRHCLLHPEAGKAGQTGRAYPYLVGIEFSAEAKESFPFLEIQGRVLRYQAAHSVFIEAEASSCYRLTTEFERYPEWAKEIVEAKVHDRYPDGRGRRVELVANIYFRKVRTLLDYSYDDRGLCLSWVSAGGDLQSVSGRYFFKPQGSQRAAATCELSMILDFPVPNRIVRYFSQIVMRRSMRDFKVWAEKS